MCSEGKQGDDGLPHWVAMHIVGNLHREFERRMSSQPMLIVQNRHWGRVDGRLMQSAKMTKKWARKVAVMGIHIPHFTPA